MSDTPNLLLPFMAAGQADGYVPHNEALVRLDGLVLCHVKDRSHSTPPTASNGDTYIVLTAGTDVWTGLDNNIVTYYGGTWYSTAPVAGMRVWVVNEQCSVMWSGSSWLSLNESIFCAEKITSSQSLSSSFAGITFNSHVKYNSAGVFTHSTSSNTDQITLEEAGDYEVQAEITFDYTSGTNNPCELQLTLNGSAITSCTSYSFVSSTIDKMTCTITRTVTAGANAILRVEGRVTAGGAQALAGGCRVVVRKLL